MRAIRSVFFCAVLPIALAIGLTSQIQASTDVPRAIETSLQLKQNSAIVKPYTSAFDFSGTIPTALRSSLAPAQISAPMVVGVNTVPTCNCTISVPAGGSISTASGVNVTVGGSIIAGSANGQPSSISVGDGVFANSFSSGQIWLCGSSTVKPYCNIDFDMGGGNNRVTVHGHLRVLSDIDTYGGVVNLNPNNNPPQPTLSYTAGGTLPQTTYYVRLTPVSLVGEGYSGNASAEASITVPASNLLVVTAQNTVNYADEGFSPQTFNVYVSTASGNYSTGLQATGIKPGGSWTEPTSGLVSGVALPSVDDSAGVILSSRFALNQPVCTGIPSFSFGQALPFDGDEYILSNNCTATNAQFNTVFGTSHHVCSGTSGWPCETTATCSLSSASTCTTPAMTVPAGSLCNATPNANDTTTGEYAPKINASFQVVATVASSQTSTASFNVSCQ